MNVHELDRPRSTRRHLALAVAVLGALAVWTVVHLAPWLEPRAATLHPAPEAEIAPKIAFPTRSAPLRAPVERAPEVAEDGLPIMPADPSAPMPAGPVHPHPTTPAHLRIYRENNLLGALNGALDVKDASGMRRLLAQYREEYPEDPHELQAGYAIIADCLDHPGNASTAAASHYYDTELASTLRRYVRRHCLE